jgi:hypothetical protein
MVLGLSWLLGSLGTVLWLRSWLGEEGALVAALVYTYLPFQIATVYVRGAWGEALFWGLLPWALLTATFLVTSPRVLLVPVAAIFWLALGLSQLGLTVWALIFVILLLLVVHARRSLLPILAAVLGSGVALAGYSLLSPLVLPAPVAFTDHFLYPFQLFSAYWGFGASRTGWEDGLSFQLGLAAIGLTLLSVILWSQSRLSGRDRRLVFFLGTALFLCLLQFFPALFAWPPGFFLAGLLTYPWQLLGLAGLCLAVLAGAALGLEPRLSELPLFGAVVLLILVSSYSYLEPQFIQAQPFIAGQPVGPEAQLDEGRLALLDHRFQVAINGHTAGLNQGQTAIPIAVYGPLQPHDTLLVQVTWQPLRAFNQNWKVFAHLVDADNNVLAQFDGYPQGGTYPTSQWIPGEIIQDRYPLLLPAEFSPGPYRLYLGLYDEETLVRLPVSGDPEGRIVLDVAQDGVGDKG